MTKNKKKHHISLIGGLQKGGSLVHPPIILDFWTFRPALWPMFEFRQPPKEENHSNSHPRHHPNFFQPSCELSNCRQVTQQGMDRGQQFYKCLQSSDGLNSHPTIIPEFTCIKFGKWSIQPSSQHHPNESRQKTVRKKNGGLVCSERPFSTAIGMIANHPKNLG